MDFDGPDALLDRLVTAPREVVFLVGAPLTAPTSAAGLGVPGVAAMVDRIRALFAGRKSSLEELERALGAAANPYQVAFRYVHHRRGPDVANQIIRDAVLAARLPEARTNSLADGAAHDQLENDLEGWHYAPGVLALGQLAARQRKRFGCTLLTTNFDPLLELSIRKAEGRAYSSVLHSDGSLEQTRAEGSHVVHLHGSWYGTDTLHSPAQLGQDRPRLRASLARLVRDRTLVVMAYGGWDDIMSRTLQEVTADPGAYPDVLWCFYETDPAKIERQNASLFKQLEPAIGRGRAIFYAGIDCHAFLPQLVAEVAADAPTITVRGAASLPAGGGAVVGAMSPVREEAAFAERKAEQSEVMPALERGQPVQLIGPRSMGKSSLLRWAERSARTLGRQVAFVNARGLAGRSPADLVLAVAEALGKRAVVRDALYAKSALPTSEEAAQALLLLVPVCLLVDEAGALAEWDHAFDRGFLDMLRALCQDGRLQWISASEQDLLDLFQSTGLTSQFLNDARRIRVGTFARADAEALLRERGATPEQVAFAYELGGGLPPAVGWLGQRLNGAPANLSEVERELVRWIRPMFLLWWQRLKSSQRAFLKGCVGEGRVVDGLANEERRLAQGLVDAGFLREREGKFGLEGRAWGEFVRDAG